MPRKKTRSRSPKKAAALVLGGLIVLLGAAVIFSYLRLAPSGFTPPEELELAKQLGREAEKALSGPGLGEKGELVDSTLRRSSAGPLVTISWQGPDEKTLFLAEQAVERAWRKVRKDIRVGVSFPDHPRGSERVVMVAGVSAKPLVQLSLSLAPSSSYRASGAGLSRQPPLPGEPASSPSRLRSRPEGRIAIIIDDIGNSMEELEELLAIPVPLTFSVLPYADHTQEARARLLRAGAAVMLHLPMQPISYPATDPGPGALLLRMNPDQIKNAFERALAKVPEAEGVNNHMGSAFTADRQAMTALMKAIKRRGLFFIDSRTTPDTVAFMVARQMQVPAGERRVFLDHTRDPEVIEAELQRLAAKAAEQGTAIGIGHPYPETVAVLKKELPKMAAQGWVFITAQEAVR